MLGIAVVALVAASRRVIEAKASLRARKARRASLLGLGQTEAVYEVDLQISDLELDIDVLERALVCKIEEVHRAFDAHHGVPIALAGLLQTAMQDSRRLLGESMLASARAEGRSPK